MKNKDYLKHYKIVLITGAARGIGYEFASRLAAMGKDLILIARDKAGLEAIKRELEDKHAVNIYTCVCDLTSELALEQLTRAIGVELPEPDVLINNAGASCYGEFKDLPLARQLALIRLNNEAVVKLTYRALAAMVKKGRGAVLNVASTSGFMPIPFNAVYSASKAFVINFSLALAKEVLSYGVRVSCLCPGPVDTSFWRSAGMEAFARRQKRLASPGEIALYGIALLRKGESIGIPGAGTKLKQIIRFFLPLPLLSEYLYRHMRPLNKNV